MGRPGLLEQSRVLRFVAGTATSRQPWCVEQDEREGPAGRRATTGWWPNSRLPHNRLPPLVAEPCPSETDKFEELKEVGQSSTRQAS